MDLKNELEVIGMNRKIIVVIFFIALVFYVINSIYSLRNLMLENKLLKIQLDTQ